MKNIVLIGDAWVCGSRDLGGVAIPLTSKLSPTSKMGSAAIVRDMSAPGGLAGALRRIAVATQASYGESPEFVVVLGVEDAEHDPLPEDWCAGYSSLVRQILAFGPVLLVVPPAFGSGRPTGRFGRKAKRWVSRVPKMAVARAISDAASGVRFVEVPDTIERADDVWLRPSGVRTLAGHIAHSL